MSDFRRTHHDNWQEHKQKFTEDQLLVLTDLLVSPCYYAWMALVALNENSTEDSALMSADDNRTVSSAKHVALVIRSPSDKFQKRIYSSDNICVHDPFFPTIIALCWRSFFSIVVLLSYDQLLKVVMLACVFSTPGLGHASRFCGKSRYIFWFQFWKRNTC